MNIIPFGDRALLINLEQKIDLGINNKIHSLDQKIRNLNPIGFQYSIPAYCSLTLVYDDNVVTYDQFKNTIQEIASSANTVSQPKVNSNNYKIPVCYACEFGTDLASFASNKSLSIEEVITLHSSRTYNVYMLGFLPGFAYMGTVDKKLEAKRKMTPLLHVPRNSVAIAGLQTSIYPIDSPGGWQIIGRTPIDVLSFQLSDNPILFNPGDTVQFYPITKSTYVDIKESTEDPRLQLNNN